MSYVYDILLIDNTSRLSHDANIKKIAIKRAKRMNSNWYKFYRSVFINPSIYLCIYLRYPLVFLQEILIKLEQKLNKLL